MVPILIFTNHPAPAPKTAALQSLMRNPEERLIGPTCRRSLCRNKPYSIQAATPDAAVSPATPHLSSMPSHTGHLSAAMTPSVMASNTRIMAMRNGVWVSFRA